LGAQLCGNLGATLRVILRVTRSVVMHALPLSSGDVQQPTLPLNSAAMFSSPHCR
jgi:hypothetical protein